MLNINRKGESGCKLENTLELILNHILIQTYNGLDHLLKHNNLENILHHPFDPFEVVG